MMTLETRGQRLNNFSLYMETDRSRSMSWDMSDGAKAGVQAPQRCEDVIGKEGRRNGRQWQPPT